MQHPTIGTEARLIRVLETTPLVVPKKQRPRMKTPSVRPELALVAPTSSQKTVTRASPVFAGATPSRPGALFDLIGAQLAAGGVSGGTAAELEAFLRGLGFRRAGKKLKKGNLEIRLSMRELAGRTAVQIDVRGKENKKQVEHRGVVFGGVLMNQDCFDALVERFDREIAQFNDAVKRRGATELPTSLDALKTFVKEGQGEKAKVRDAEREAELEAELDGLTARIRRMRAAGTAPRGVVVYAAGPDAAGKSSTGAIVLDAFEAAGYAPRREVFKGPSKEEQKAPHLRFRRGIPEDGEVVFWDRGPAGDVVYGGRDLAEVAGHFKELEDELAERGILLIKLELFADRPKQAKTLGKRLARQYIADRIEAVHPNLSPEVRAGLSDIRGRVDDDDFRAFARFPEVQAAYERFMEASPGFIVVDASKRHPARLEIVARVDEAVQAGRWQGSRAA